MSETEHRRGGKALIEFWAASDDFERWFDGPRFETSEEAIEHAKKIGADLIARGKQITREDFDHKAFAIRILGMMRDQMTEILGDDHSRFCGEGAAVRHAYLISTFVALMIDHEEEAGGPVIEFRDDQTEDIRS